MYTDWCYHDNKVAPPGSTLLTLHLVSTSRCNCFVRLTARQPAAGGRYDITYTTIIYYASIIYACSIL